MRKIRTDGQATRDAILAAAEVEFSEQGFEIASVRAICTKAGANVALANRYFGSKEDLYRIVAKRLFGDLGAPMAAVAEKATTKENWRAAVHEWVWDFLFMTLPTERPQVLCRGLFRHEVTRPTKFHDEFLRDYGKPIYDSLFKLVSMVEKDAVRLELLTSSIWSQIAVYALADESWQKNFRPKGVTQEAWRETICDHICETFFASVGELTADKRRQRVAHASAKYGERERSPSAKVCG